MFSPFSKRFISVASSVVVMLAVGGCAGDANSFSFDQPASEKDKLPLIVDTAGLDSSTSRHLGADSSGTDYYVVRVPSKKDVCLVVVGVNHEWAQGCSEQLPITVSVASIQSTASLNQRISKDCPADRECVGEYVQVQRGTSP